MNLRRPAFLLLAITACYVAVLAWVDTHNDVFSALPVLSSILPGLVAAALLSIAVRYCRWRWLMKRAGHTLPWRRGFLAYCSGFAFTASPGKVGELIRIRYHGPLGIPAARVLSAFVYERAFDLICVLALASLFATVSRLFLFASVFVAVALLLVVLVACRPGWVTYAGRRLPTAMERRIQPLLQTLGEGLAGTRRWATPTDFAFCAIFGLLAWGLLAMAFSALLAALGVQMPAAAALAAYPLAMLAGAASMIPGGLGSTEAAIVALLTGFGSNIPTATVAAVGIRLATLWFAIVLGLASVTLLEARSR